MSALFVLVEEPLDTLLDAFVQRPQRLIAENTLRLGNVEVPRHARHCHLLLVESGRLADDGASNLTEDTKDVADLLGHVPDAIDAGGVARGGPDGTSKVPKVDGGVVGDHEGLAVDLFMVEGRGGGGGGGDEGAGGEEVGVGDVADVGEVKDVHVVADLDLVLAVVVGADEAGEGLAVALAEEGGGSDGAGEEV